MRGLAGSVPVSRQDGDHAALNRIALGTQTVSHWKDAPELGKQAAEIAALLADGKKMSDVPGVTTFSAGPKKVAMKVLLLTPVPITKDNLGVVIDAGWIKKAEVCQGVKPNRWRVRWSISPLCCSGVLIGTNRILVLVTASQMASASAASFFCRLT